MPRFVILEHDYPELHWDFMLECAGALKTWRLAEPPATHGELIAAVALEDHRLDYLDYEGPVSGNRGRVKRWDRGDYEGSLASDSWKICVIGAGLQAWALMDGKAMGIRFVPIRDDEPDKSSTAGSA